MDGTITIGTKLDTKSFDKQIEDLQNKLQDLEKQKIYFETKNMQGEFQDVELEIEKIKNKLIQLNTQKEKLNDTKAIDNLGKSFEKSIKSVAKLALGIFGIRSAYMALRRASSDLATYDEQYATNLEYIRFVLTQAIAPVLRGIVSLAMKLLQIIGMIANALFGVNIFSKGSAEAFNKMKKAAGGVSKAVKEIKKQLAGFDEINMLTNQSDTGTSVGAGGIGMPDIDLSKLQGETPEWIKWISENKDLIFAVLAGIASGILAIKFGLDGIKALGIGILVTGIITTIQNLIKYLKDPSWKNFGKIIQGVGVAIIGLGAIIGSVPVAVAGAIVLIVGTIVKYWEQIKAGFNKAIDLINNGIEGIQKWFVENIDKIYDKFGWFGVGVVAVVVGLVSSIMGIISGLIETVKQLLDGLFTGIKQIFNGILEIFKGNFKQGFISIMKGLGNIIIGIINTVTSAINAILYPIRALIAEGGKIAGKNWTVNTVKIPQIPLLKVGGIVNVPNKGTMIGGAIAGESRSRRCTSIDRCASHGNFRSNNREVYYN